MQSAARVTEPNFAAEQQTRAESDLDYRVWFIAHQLEQAARGDSTAWSLSNAMASIAAPNRGGPISTAQRDALLSAVVRAQLGAIKYLPKSYRRKQIAAGMQALAHQIMLWAETPERSLQRPQHVLSDIDAYARMFRNDLHNISLRDEMDRRDWQRRDAEIQKLLRPNDGSIQKRAVN